MRLRTKKTVKQPVRRNGGQKCCLERLLRAITRRNLHQEIDFGRTIGNEAW